MKRFFDLRLRQQLLAGFGIVVACAVVVGGVGMASITRIRAADEAMYDRMTVPLAMIGDLRSEFLQTRIAVLYMVKDGEDDERWLANARQHLEVLTERVDSLRPLVHVDDVHFLDEVARHAATYGQNIARIRETRAAGDGPGFESAMAEARNVSQALTMVIGDLTEMQVGDAAETAAANEVLSKRAITAMALVLALSVLLGLAIALVLARRIGGTVRRVAERVESLGDGAITGIAASADAMAVGDFSRTVTVDTVTLNITSRDEVGSLARSVDEISARAESTTAAFDRLRSTMERLIDDAGSIVKACAAGNLEYRGDPSAYRGVFRDMIEAMNGAVVAVERPVSEAVDVLGSLARKDLTRRMVGQGYQGAYAEIQRSLNQAVDDLDGALTDVALAAREVAAASGQIAAGSQSLAEGASEQASSLEEVSSSLQELASMATQNAANATEARSLAEAASGSTESGASSMTRLSSTVRRIKESSDATSKIVKTIDEIAFQTNLLALNAAVEAARAGEAGKGFAVVAEEVRNLAMRSAEAAKETSALIAQSVEASEEGVAVQAEVVEKLGEIRSGVSRVREVMAEIAAASEQQTEGVGQINGAVEEMNTVTQRSAASSEESASSAEELSSQAERMQALAGRFTLTSAGSAPQRGPARSARVAGDRARGPVNRVAGRSDDGSALIPFDGDPVLQGF